ncbi:MAG: TaqI-like C-terminal specificity domain-containing protein [Byssovorax sp.]
MSAGPATGRDGVYVVTPETSAGIEPELLRRAVRGRDLAAYHIEDPGLQVLVPYTFDRHGTPSIADLAAFPGARRYLTRHRADLEARHCVRVWGKAWYDLHDQVLLNLAGQTKILVPDVASSNRFAVDPGRYFPLHSVYYLIPKNDIDPYYLTAIMNSRMAEFLIRLLSPVVKDGFSRYRQQFLATVPVPDGRPEEVKEIIAAARAGDADRADQLVTALFHPSDADLARIDRYIAARAIASGPAALRCDRGVS